MEQRFQRSADQETDTSALIFRRQMHPQRRNPPRIIRVCNTSSSSTNNAGEYITNAAHLSTTSITNPLFAILSTISRAVLMFTVDY